MNKNKKIAIFIVIVLVGVILALSTLFLFKSEDVDSDIIVKDNVKIITSKIEKDFQPTNVTIDAVCFENNPKYKVGDVVVAGIIDSAPNGFIRKIVSVSKENGMYVYETEPAVLTDVFEKLHIIKTFTITDQEIKDIENIDNGVMTLDLSSKNNNPIQLMTNHRDSNIPLKNDTAVKIKPSDEGLGIAVELNDNIGESLKINGQIQVATYLEIKFDIEDGEIDFGMAIHTNTNGELFVGYQEELFDKNNKDKFNGEYQKEIISKTLPNIQFAIGPVPVVITNDFELSAEISTQLKGQIGTTIGINAEKVSGFEYSSKTGQITEINEKKYLSDGMDWKTEASASGELEAGIYAHLITKLYGSTGTDLSIGIAGNLNGELGLGVDKELTPILYGNLSLSIGPRLNGKIVVTIPVIDYNLLEADIFKVALPAFWEKKWEIPKQMLDSSSIEIGNSNESDVVLSEQPSSNEETSTDDESENVLSENSTSNIEAVVDYDGVDWVSIESFTSAKGEAVSENSMVGKSFYSGSGILYKIVAEEINNDSGRTRIILKSADGKKWMIPNMPAFKLDSTTGISYYNIYEYSSSPNYVEYNTAE